MDVSTMKWLAGMTLLIILAFLIFYSAYRIRQKKLKKLFQVKCNIYLKKGGKEVIWVDMRKDKFERKTLEKNSQDKNKVNMYFIIKEAIQEEIEKGIIFTRITKYLDFYEDLALPFIMGLIHNKTTDDPQQKFLGSARAHQLYRENIWDKIGGIGKNSGEFGTLTYIMIAGIVLIVVYFFFIKK